jgi:type II secretory pathway pseudopilin PulG
MSEWLILHRPNWRGEAGFTLAEALVSTAIVVVVATVLSSLLFTLLRSHQWFLQRTDQSESLRIAAAHIRQDARFATDCFFGPKELTLHIEPLATDITYKITPNAEGKHDLHRVVYQGGNPQSDDIVGWDILPAVSTGANKSFICVGDLGKGALVRLQTRALPGQKAAPKLEVFSFQRSD